MLEIYKHPAKPPKNLIGEIDKPPYEILWDISEIPDQDQYRLSFGFEVIYKDGKKYMQELKYGVDKDSFYVIDRNSDIKPLTVPSFYLSKPPVLDGSPGEWKTMDSIVFRNNDNTVTAWSAWDRNHLYVASRVFDDTLVSLPHKFFSISKKGEKFLRNFLWDGIEFCFDFYNRKWEFKDSGTAEICISVDSVLVGRRDYVVDGGTVQRFEEGINFALQKNAGGYCVEAAIPWSLANIIPERGKEIGFEVINKDRDDTLGHAIFASWTGVQSFNSDNPSEWGNLKLIKEEPRYSIIVGMFAAILLMMALFILLIKKKKPFKPEDSQVKDKPYEQKGGDRTSVIREYVEQNLTKEDLSLKQAAAYFKMNYSYLSTLFKESIGEAFPDYVNRRRIEKAKELLASSDVSITQIALDLGFTSSSYFNRIFKERENLTPSEFREKYFKKS